MRGLGTLTPFRVSDALRQLATDYGATVYQDSMSLSMDMLSENLEKSLSLLSDFILRPRLSADDFMRIKKRQIANVLAGKANPKNARNKVMMRALFGEGYIGLPSGGLTETLESITLKEVTAAYKALIKPSGSTLIVVGDVSRAELEPLLKDRFSTWRGEPSVSPRPLLAEQKVGAIHWVDFPGSTQSAVAMVRRAQGQTETKDAMSEELFNLVFGGKFTSRLNLNLREDKGYTYGAYSGLYRYQKTGMHFLSGMIKGDQTAAAIKEMISEIDRISTDHPISAEELERVRGGELKGYPAKFEERSGVVGLLSEARRENRGPAWLNEWMNKMRRSPLNEAQRSAQTLAKSDEYSIIIAGDKAKHLASITALNRPIYYYTPDGYLISPEPTK